MDSMNGSAEPDLPPPPKTGQALPASEMVLEAPTTSPGQGPVDREEVVKNVLAGLTTSFAAIALGAAFGDAAGRGALVGILSAGTIALITATLGGTRVQCSGPTAPMTTVTTAVVTYSRTGMFNDITSDLFNGTSPGCDQHSYDSQLCPLPDRFVNIVMMMGGVLILLMGMLRLGKYISLVPNVVISGFMNGIATQIWEKQVIKLAGTCRGTSPQIRGSWALNFPIVIATTTLCFWLPTLLRRVLPHRIAKSMPATLCVIVLVTLFSIYFDDCVACEDCDYCVEKTQLGATITSFGDLSDLVSRQFPTSSDFEVDGLMPAAFMYALQLAVLCYLDTLLTSLVIDKMNGEATNKEKELGAQGLANFAVSAFGGLPGAQATIRSVLILKEGGTMRLAGMVTGFFVIIEMVIFQHMVKLIPQAVFTGILLKIGYDVFDFTPFTIYMKAFAEARLDSMRSIETLKQKYTEAARELAMYDLPENEAGRNSGAGDSEASVVTPSKSKKHVRAKVKRFADALGQHGNQVDGWAEIEASDASLANQAQGDVIQRTTSAKMFHNIGRGAFKTLVDTTKALPEVGHLEMLFIMGTTAVTVVINLNAAVGTFTLLFHLFSRLAPRYPVLAMRDLSTDESKHSAMSAARKAEVAGEGLSGNLLSNGAGMGAGAPVVSSGEVGSPLGKGAIGDYRSGEL